MSQMNMNHINVDEGLLTLTIEQKTMQSLFPTILLAMPAGLGIPTNRFDIVPCYQIAFSAALT